MIEEFRTKSLVDQLLMLDGLERSGLTGVLPELIDLWADPSLDEVVRFAAGDVLRVLLAGSEGDVAAGLSSANPELRRLCLQVAVQARFLGTAPTLLALAERETEPEALTSLLSALTKLGVAEAAGLARLRVRHEDPVVSAQAVELLGELRAPGCVEELCRLVSEAEAEGAYDRCALSTQKAIEVLSALGTEEALGFLVGKIHHRGPTARRFLHEELVRHGPAVVEPLGRVLEDGDGDEVILAANVLGLIGDPRGADLLVEGFERGRFGDPNARFAAYEALGRISGLKALVRLTEGLDEGDEAVLLAVVPALNAHLAPGIVRKMQGVLCDDPLRGRALARAVVGSRALDTFEALWAEAKARDPLAAALEGCTDPETRAAFRGLLLAMEGDRAAEIAAALGAPRPETGSRRVLAVDDSRSMLFFYAAALTESGLEVRTAADGAEALSLLLKGEPIDLILTDLNMPRMDGIELAAQVRSSALLRGIPVVMATTESEGSQREAAQRAGVSAFLTKPVKPEILREVVLRLL